MSNKQITQNATIHPIGDGKAEPASKTLPPTGAIGCSAVHGGAFVDDRVFVLLDEIVAIECLDGEAGRALLRDGRQITLGYSAPAVLARLREIYRGKETGPSSEQPFQFDTDNLRRICNSNGIPFFTPQTGWSMPDGQPLPSNPASEVCPSAQADHLGQ